MGFNYANDTLKTNVFSDRKTGEDIVVTGQITRKIFSNGQGFSIYEMEKDNRKFKVSGTFPIEPSISGHYKISGKISEYKGEKQITVESIRSVIPTDKDGLIRVLKTLPGVDTKAYKLYDLYGESVISTIMNNPNQVSAALKIPLSRINEWQRKIKDNEEYNAVLNDLTQYGLSPANIRVLYDKYGIGTLEQIKKFPYSLSDELPNFGFSKCDDIALQVGVDASSIDRLSYGVKHILYTIAYGSGDCYVFEDDLIANIHSTLDICINAKEANSLLNSKHSQDSVLFEKYGKQYSISIPKLRKFVIDWNNSLYKKKFRYVIMPIPDEYIQQALSLMLGSNTIIKEDVESIPCYFLGSIYDAENFMAAKVDELIFAEHSPFEDVDSAIASYCKEENITLEDKQLEAVERFTEAKGGLFILSGSAGCGKTFTLNVILGVLRMLYKREGRPFNIKLLSPTGRAAQVVSESTGLPACTIHKELGLIDGDQTTSGAPVSLFADCLIVDEFSMVDVFLASKLFSAIRPYTKVILLGDIKQLPSIGPGAVLKDLMQCGKVPTIILNVVKRQAKNSGIITNANKILAGEMISSCLDEGSKSRGSFLLRKSDAFACREAIVQAVEHLSKKKKLTDIQVLCPQKKTEIGVNALNYLLQQSLVPFNENTPKAFNKSVLFKDSPNAKETEHFLYFRVGDKVINTKNDYNAAWYERSKAYGYAPLYSKTGIMNGECGIIHEIISNAGERKGVTRIVVKYGEFFVFYDNDYSNLDHAFAMTVHKAQGSQWPIVISPVTKENSNMLNCYLFYTMFTRAQKSSYIYGQEDAIRKAISKMIDVSRKTRLRTRIAQKP